MDRVELLIDLKTAGDAELRRTVATLGGGASGAGLEGAAASASRSITKLSGSLGMAGTAARGFVGNLGGMGLAVTGIASGVTLLASALVDLYVKYDPLTQAQQRSLGVLQETARVYETLIGKSEELRLKELELLRGREFVLGSRAQAAQHDVDFAQRRLDEIDRRITAGTIAQPSGGRKYGVPVTGALNADAQVATVERYNVQRDLENAQEALKIIRQETSIFKIEEQREVARKVESAAKRRLDEFFGLLDSLNERGLDPLAKLISGAERRLVEIVSQYGPLKGDERLYFDQALGNAINSEVERQRQAAGLYDISTTGIGAGRGRARSSGILNLQGPGMTDATIDPTAGTKLLERLNAMRVDGVRRQLDYEERLAMLLAGPGGQVSAIQSIAQLRVEAAQREFDITKDKARFNTEVQEAERTRIVSLLEFQQQRLNQFKDQARGVFRSILQGGGGFDAFLKTTGTQLAEQFFVNASGKMFETVGPKLGGVGKALGLPDFLTQGTLFESSPMDANTLSQDRNTLALEQLTGVLSGTGAGGGISGGGLLSAIQAVGTVGKSRIMDLPLSDSGLRMDGNHTSGYATSSGGGFSWARALGVAGAAGAGATGILSGVREGGGRGALTATGSGLGATAGILMAAGVSGPLAPILLGVGLGVGFIKALLPDPRQQFEEAQNKVIASRAFKPSEAREQFGDLAGSGVDYFDTDFKGRTRIQRTVVVNVSIQAADAQSFKDMLDRNPEALSKSIGDQMRAGEPNLTLGVNQIILGPGAA